METTITPGHSKNTTPQIGWGSGQLIITTLIAGPLGGFYLISQNLKSLGNYTLANKVLLVGGIGGTCLLTALLYLAAIMMPENLLEVLPNAFIIRIIYSMVIVWYATKKYYPHPLFFDPGIGFTFRWLLIVATFAAVQLLFVHKLLIPALDYLL